ncbi:DUF4190 domain-containing protein [Urbifossiella limnaea]|uniref:DUF4190 domain-containing protein n=1 Tax=Urbifossiella limnaea TaxID=2528023 RepID=A0A517XXH5_9BACT|nr:DUF4190 domain-containing protein [Urbifossiella limnaea]QDU22216.1 hypothetical protein ETAA1_41930 [Urbifossiella limnaea]
MPDPDDDYDDAPPRRRPRRDYEEDDDNPDDRPRRRRRPPPTDDGLQYVVPVNTNVLAILAGYAGLVSLLCFPAPFALLLGILALRQLKRNPGQHGKGRAIFGIVMGVLFTLLGLTAVVAAAFAK